MKPSPRILVLLALLAALLFGLAAYACAARPAAGREPAAPPASPLPDPAAGGLAGAPGSGASAAGSDAAAADPGPGSGAATATAAATDATAADGGPGVLAAVLVARRVCTLVDRRAYAAARWLFVDVTRWPGGLWRRLRRVRFRSARVVDVRGGRAPVVRLNVRVATPASRRGLRTLVFTLGRVGTDGEWLVYAVRTPVHTRERGPTCPPSPPTPAGLSPD